MKENRCQPVSVQRYWKSRVSVPVLFLVLLNSLVAIFLTQFLIDKNNEKQNLALSTVLISSIKPSFEFGDSISVQAIIKNFTKNTGIQALVRTQDNVVIAESESFKTANSSQYKRFDYSISDPEGVSLGNLVLKMKVDSLSRIIVFMALLISPITLIFLTMFILRKVNKIIKHITFSLKEVEIPSHLVEINDVKNLILVQRETISENVKLDFERKIYKQVAHDIRSPLEALKSIESNVEGLDLTTKKIVKNSVKRITEIASTLINYKPEISSSSLVNIKLLLHEISSTFSVSNSRVKLDFSEGDYNSYYISSSESVLYRSFVNLVSNAIESYDDNKGVVLISTLVDSDKVIVNIADQGKGMSIKLLADVLKGGVTTKKYGNGIGLSYSRESIFELNGLFQIDSEEGKGTRISITFDRALVSNLFVDNLIINESNIICVDDDLSFLQLYKKRLKRFNIQTYNSLYHLSESKVIDSQLFIDFDLKGEKTGLDFIIENNISTKATLVTSMYQDEDIQKRCFENGIKILPKQIFNNARVLDLTKRDSFSYTDEEARNSVLIDDDELIHMSWKMEAERAGVNLDCYYTVNEFMDKISNYSTDTTIYVDSNLSDGIKGEIESKKIFDAGFKEIYLATGYAPSDFDKPNWIKEIVGKRASFKK